MNVETHQRPAICILHVVDAGKAPLCAGLPTLAGREVALTSYRTASSALRAARQRAEGIWLVGLSLPDLTGAQLIEMLVGCSGRKMIAAVGDVYSPEDETAALSSGACQYFVKPLAVELCRAMINIFMESAAGVSGQVDALRNRAFAE